MRRTSAKDLGKHLLRVDHIARLLVHTRPTDLVVKCPRVGIRQDLVCLSVTRVSDWSWHMPQVNTPNFLELGLRLWRRVLVRVELRAVSNEALSLCIGACLDSLLPVRLFEPAEKSAKPRRSSVDADALDLGTFWGDAQYVVQLGILDALGHVDYV